MTKLLLTTFYDLFEMSIEKTQKRVFLKFGKRTHKIRILEHCWTKPPHDRGQFIARNPRRHAVCFPITATKGLFASLVQ